MTPEKYIAALKSNIIRLNSDAEFLLSGNRKHMAVLCYITLVEEYMKLENYCETKTLNKRQTHFEKLAHINNYYKKGESIFRAEDTHKEFSEMMNLKLDEIFDNLISNTADTVQKAQLIELRKTTDRAVILEGINSLCKHLLTTVGENFSRLYSNTVRELCLYVDWNQKPLSESELDAQITMYQKIASGVIMGVEKIK